MERQIFIINDFIDFFEALDVGAKRKVAYVLDMLKILTRISPNFVKRFYSFARADFSLLGSVRL